MSDPRPPESPRFDFLNQFMPGRALLIATCFALYADFVLQWARPSDATETGMFLLQSLNWVQIFVLLVTFGVSVVVVEHVLWSPFKRLLHETPIPRWVGRDESGTEDYSDSVWSHNLRAYALIKESKVALELADRSDATYKTKDDSYSLWFYLGIVLIIDGWSAHSAVLAFLTPFAGDNALPAIEIGSTLIGGWFLLRHCVYISTNYSTIYLPGNQVRDVILASEKERNRNKRGNKDEL